MTAIMPGALIMRTGSQETTLATFNVPLRIEATTDPGVAHLVLDVDEFRSLLTTALREAAAEVEKIPDTDPRAPGGPQHEGPPDHDRPRVPRSEPDPADRSR